jgi:GTPase-associated protein 1, N-terminal domain type 2
MQRRPWNGPARSGDGLSDVIEQLHYTWALRGLQGAGQFQVVATSPLLRNLNGDLARLTLRLCRWTADTDPGTTSFGWIDARGYRLIFRRAPTGTAGDGRPGNFAAHILVAAAGTLDAAHMFRPAAPGLWWDGDGIAASGALPTLKVQPVGPPMPPARDEEVETALAEMLATEFRGQICASWNSVYAAAAAAAASVPRAFAGVTAFSTYESADTAGWFTLAGVGNKAALATANPAAMAAARLLLSKDATNRRMLHSVAEGTTTWPDFVALANALSGMRDGNGEFGMSHLVPALQRPSTAQEVLSFTAARASVAAEAAAGRAEVLTPLARNLSSLSDDIQYEMGRSIGAALDKRERGWFRPASGLGRLPARTLEGLAEVALVHVGPDSCPFWPVTLLTACLRLPQLDGSAVGDLVDATLVLDRGAAAVDDWTIPAVNRAALAAAAMRRQAVSAERLSRLMREDRAFERALVPRLEGPGDLWSTLQLYPPYLAAQSVLHSAKLVPLGALTDVVRQLLPRLDEYDATKLEGNLRSLRKDIPGQVWNEAADQRLMVLVGTAVSQTDRRLSPAALSSQCGGGPLGTACRAVLGEVLQTGRRFDTTALARVADALKDPDLERQPEFRTLAGQALVQEATRYEHLEDVVFYVARPLRENHLEWFVFAALRNLASGAPGSRGLAVLTLQFAIVHNVAAKVVVPVARRLDHRGWDQLAAAFAHPRRGELRRLDALVRATSPATSRSWFTSNR